MWWPPQQPDASLPDPAAAVKQEAAATKAVAEPAGFSSETMAILSSLGGGKVDPVEAPDSTPEADAPVSGIPLVLQLLHSQQRDWGFLNGLVTSVVTVSLT